MQFFRRVLRRLQRRNWKSLSHRALTHFETMEARNLLAADPLHAGIIYVEQDTGSDAHGDLFELTFRGGAPGTQLRRIVIDGDQNITGFGVGDVFFDVAPTGYGGDSSFAFRVDQQTGIDSVHATVVDGQSRLILDFVGFDAGEKLVFSVDVDEVEEFDPTETDLAIINEGFDPITSGVEFQGTHFSAEFSAADFYDIRAESTFRNRYDDQLAASGLDLPPDDFQGRRDRSAGAFVSTRQTHIPAILSGFVFHDRDDDGIRDPGEEGIAGVQIRVDPIQTVIDQSPVTITTDAHGYYRASGLVAGRYRVVEVANPSGFLDGKDRAGTVNGTQRGIVRDDLIDEIRLRGGEQGVEFNFGELLPVTIRGQVHLADRQGNCFQEGRDNVPVAGARVLLYDQAGTLLGERITGADGRYEFQGLRPGTFKLVEITPAHLINGESHVGLIDGVRVGTIGSDGSITAIAVPSGKTAEHYDFCELVPSTLTGYVYHDRDDDGLRESGEEGIAQVVLQLIDAQGRQVATTTTNDQGHYQFNRLRAGKYTVVQVQPAGWVDGRDTPGTVQGLVSGLAVNPGDRIEKIEVLWGDTGQNYNFGEIKLASLRGSVHLSTRDGDCFGESSHNRPIAGVILRLFDSANRLVAETTTNQLGEYEFSGLRPGTYRIVEVTPTGLLEGGAQAGTVNGTARGQVENVNVIGAIRIFSDEHGERFDFCDHEPAQIAGFVYHDREQDGRKDADNEGIRGVLIRLVDREGREVARTTTDAVGYYEFRGLSAGIYSLIEAQPGSWRDGVDTAGTVHGAVSGRAVNPGDQIRDIDLRWGDSGVDYNFGEFLSAVLRGRVQLADRDGRCDGAYEDHAPVANAIVRLFDQQGRLVAEQRTDADGRYEFGGLVPGVYRIVELTPEGLFDGAAHAGTIQGRTVGTVVDSGTISQIRVRSGNLGSRYDFCELPPATIAGFVYHDRNNDGHRDPQEDPIAGVFVELLDSQGAVVGHATTDAHGAYQIAGVRAGTYALRETQPAGWLDGLDSAGVVNGNRSGQPDQPGDRISQIVVGWGDHGTEFNFGELLAGSITGIVHTDIGITNCVFEPARGEITLAGVTVELLDASGRVLARTQTNAAGRYTFANLRPGTYQVRETQPVQYFDGKARAGSHGGQDSTANLIAAIPVGSGDALTDYNFCELPPVVLSGYVFQDGGAVELGPDEQLPERIRDVRDGVLTADDRRLPGVVLELRNGVNGKAITADSALPGSYPSGPIRVRTNAEGYYEFRGIRPGTYAIYEIQPAGWSDGVDTPGTASGIVFNPGEPVNESVLQQLAVNPRDDAIVRINMQPGDRATWNNFSEVAVVRRTPRIDINPPKQPPLPPLARPVAPPLAAPPLPPAELLTPKARPYGHVIGDPRPTWHLSITDGGFPRGTGVHPGSVDAIWLTAASPDSRSPHEAPLDEGTWTLATSYGREAGRTGELQFGLPDGVPIAGDFNGDGYDEIGIYHEGNWYLDSNGNGRWDDADLWARLGDDSDQPVTGDWNGDGKDDVGIFGPRWPRDSVAIRAEPGLPDLQNPPDDRAKNLPPTSAEATDGYRALKPDHHARVRLDLIDHVFCYGRRGDRAVAGDWNGDGITTIGIFRSGTWLLDVDGNGRWSAADRQVEWGQEGDQPVVGDFNGDGIDELAIVRDGTLYLDTNHNGKIDGTDRMIPVGQPGDIAIAGDFNGDGVDEIARYRARPRHQIATRP